MLLPSVLGFALCFVCLAATTWAWFMVSVTSEANTIQTASFGVNVAVNGNPVAADANGDYTLAAGDYTIMLKPTGTATKGFVVVEVAQQTSGVVLMMAGTGVSPSSATPDTTAAGTYCTPQLFDENGVPQVATFTLKTEGTVTLTPCWGEQKDYSNLSDKSVISVTLSTSDEAQLTNEEEAPVDENQQEEEQENQQQEEENPSDENNPADDPENNGEGENTSTDTPTEGEGGQPSKPANGENGQQGGEQQGDEPSTPTDGEGEQPDVSGETTGGDIGDDTITGGESPTDTTTPAGGDVPTEPVVTTDPAAQSEGGAPANPAPSE